MSQLSQLKFAEFAYRGRLCVYLGMTDDRCLFRSGDGWTLEVPDTDTGMPVWPTEAQVLVLLASMDLIVRAKPLDDPIRQRARRLERTRQQLIDATVKDGSKRKRDHRFLLRERVCEEWRDIDGRCKLHAKAINGWLDDRIGLEVIKKEYGRVPGATTFVRWIKTRYHGRDQRPADSASESGIVPRKRRIHVMALAIIQHWANECQKRPDQYGNSYFRKAKDDIERYKKGQALELHNFEDRELQRPDNIDDVKMCCRRIFQMEVQRAKGAQAMQVAFGNAARNQRFGGGGPAQEPTRYLEYVQIDDTPFPLMLVYDPIRRLVVGTPTVTIAVCVYTRVIVGWDISFDPPCHATFMRTLLHSALPKAIPSSFSGISELALLCGKAGMYMVDNAKHQAARAAQDAGGDIGTGVRWAGAKQPTHKGVVEATLGALQKMIREKLPGCTWAIPLMREFDYNPAEVAVVTIAKFREVFAEVVAYYHTHGHSGLTDRPPLDVWIEQVTEHGRDWVRDPDHFQRAVGRYDEVQFRGDGFRIREGLRYGTNGTDDRFPQSNETFLYHFALARGTVAQTKKRTFDEVKVKYDPNDLSQAWVFDEHTEEYVAVPCTTRRYSENLPLWLHERVKAYAKAQGLAFEEDNEMLHVREEYSKMVARHVPEADFADRRAAARLKDTEEAQIYLGDTAELLRIKSSPTGMESVVEHDVRTSNRRDAKRRMPRSAAGGAKGSRARRGGKGSRGSANSRDRRDAPHSTPAPELTVAEQNRRDATYGARRSDPSWDDGSYGS